MTLIVPIDFTGISENAAVYAGNIAQQLKGRLILFHVYEKIPAGIDGTPLVNDPQARYEVRMVALEKLKNGLLGIFPDITVTCIAEMGDSLLESIETLFAKENATMIVMGVTDDNLAEQLLMGTNAINIVNSGNIPVLTVPTGVTYHGISDVVLAVDFGDEKHKLPFEHIREILELFNPKVHIVSVTENEPGSASEIEDKKAAITKALNGFETNFAFIHESNFVEAISKFSVNQKIDLIMMVPRKRSFFTSLFRSSNTEKLVHNTFIPVLALRD